jgi:hypothetical protein
MIEPITIPEDNCKKNWNNTKDTPTNQMMVLALLEAVAFVNAIMPSEKKRIYRTLRGV